MNKNSQNKQFRIRCVPFHSFLRIVFALLKINGFANKSEFVVQPYSLYYRLTHLGDTFGPLRNGDPPPDGWTPKKA